MRCTRIKPEVSQPGDWPPGNEPDDGSLAAM
jgi:hypothetical protein